MGGGFVVVLGSWMAEVGRDGWQNIRETGGKERGELGEEPVDGRGKIGVEVTNGRGGVGWGTDTIPDARLTPRFSCLL
jgi:hypothetical protein